MITKDWLKLVFAGKKRLFEMNEVSRINVPSYDELSVSNLWPHCTGIPELMMYFPDRLPKHRLPARDYFFSILMTKK